MRNGPVKLETAAEAVASAMAGGKVKVLFDSTKGPYIDLSRKPYVVHMPPIPEALDKDEICMIRGNQDHEIGHARYTDHSAIHGLSKAKFGILNAIEDGRINKLVGEEWVGAKRNLDESRKLLVARGKVREEAGEVKDLGARDLFKGLIALEYLAEGFTRDDAVKDLGVGVNKWLDILESEIVGIESLKSTWDAREMSLRVYDRLKSHLEEKEEPKSEPQKGGDGDPQSGEGGDADGDADGEGEGEDNKDGAAGDTGNGDEEKPAEQSDAQDSDDAKPTKSNDGADGKADKDPGLRDGEAESIIGAAMDAADELRPAKAMAEAMNKIINEADGGGARYLPYKNRDRTVELTGARVKASATITANEWRQAARRSVSVLRQKLMLDLMSTGRRWVLHQDKGTLDDRNLIRACTDDNRLFKNRVRRPKVETAVELLVDCSGSMSGLKILLAAKLAMIFSETLEVLGIANEVTGFTTADYATAPTLTAYNRVMPIINYVAKPFAGKFRKFAPSIVTLAEIHHASNVDGESVMWAAKRLAARSEPRKVLIVLSDGEPHSGDQAWMLCGDHLKDTVKTITNSGIECIGIGIQSKAVTKFYPDSVVFNNLTDLETGFFQKLSKVLRGSYDRK